MASPTLYQFIYRIRWSRELSFVNGLNVFMLLDYQETVTSGQWPTGRALLKRECLLFDEFLFFAFLNRAD